MRKKLSTIWVIFFSLCICLIIYQWPIHLELSFFKLLPQSPKKSEQLKALNVMDQKMVKKVIFLIENPDENSLLDSSQFWKSLLRKSEAFKLSESESLDSLSNEQVFNKLFPFKYAYQPPPTQTVEQFIQQLKEKIYTGFSPLIAFKKDPFLVFESMVDGWSNSLTHLDYRDGFLHTYHQEKPYIVIQADCNQSPFMRDYAHSAVLELESLKQTLSEKFKQTKVHHTGVLFFSNKQSKQIESEIKFISTVSLILVTLLLYSLFRTLKTVLLTFTTIGFGLINAVIVVLAFKGQCHIVTIGFGSTLIGISVDYIFHYLLGRSNNPKTTKNLFFNIGLGCLTSIFSFSTFLFTPFEVFQEISIFIIAGLSSSFLFVYLAFPKAKLKESEAPLINLSFTKFQPPLLFRKALIILSFSFCIFYFFTFNKITKFSNNIRDLGVSEESLLENDQWIKRLKGEIDTNQMTIIQSQNKDELIQLEEEFVASDFGSDLNSVMLSNFLVSISKQKSNLQGWLRFFRNNPSQLKAYLSEFNFPSNTLETIEKEISMTSTIHPDDLMDIPLYDQLFKQMVVEIETTFYSFIYHPLDALKKNQLPESDSLQHLNRVQYFSSLLNNLRQHMINYFLILYIIIFLLMIFIMGLKKGSLVCLPSTFSISLTLFTLQHLNPNGLNLFHLLATLLIWGIGMDYSIMILKSKENLSRIILANLCSSITTICSFGLLSLSHSPVLHTFGTTILSGILISFIFSALLLYKPNPQERLIK